MDIPQHLRCIECGLGRPVGGSLHTAVECRDNLRKKLAAVEVERDRLAALRAAESQKVVSRDERIKALLAERDEARALKVPPSVEELLSARMDAAVARAERDAALAAKKEADGHRETMSIQMADAVGDLSLIEMELDVEDDALGAVKRIVAERDTLRRSLDASATKVALLSAQAERAEAERDEALQDIADLSCVFEARFAAAMAGESTERLDQGVTSEQIAREERVVGKAIEQVGSTFMKLREDLAVAWATIKRLNRRAQEAERIANRAMEVGRDHVRAMEQINRNLLMRMDDAAKDAEDALFERIRQTIEDTICECEEIEVESKLAADARQTDFMKYMTGFADGAAACAQRLRARIGR